MRYFTNLIPSLQRFTALGRNAPTRRAKPCDSTILSLEELEQRDVPTVVFQPYFGAETVATSGSISNVAMPDPTVNVVFSGSYWTTSQGQEDQAMVLNSAKAILSGPYLSGLIQYGSTGTANLGGHWTDADTVPSNPSAGAVQDFLQNSLTSHHYSGASNLLAAPIYVVVSDPNSSNGYDGGWNDVGTYKQLVYLPGYGEYVERQENIHMIWIGTDSFVGSVYKDNFTRVFSHEIVETVSDPTATSIGGVTLNQPTAALQKLSDADGLSYQIGDNEPEFGAGYTYRLGGIGGNLVQAYWSVNDQAYIVPDGNFQQVDLYPYWNASLVNSLLSENPPPSFVAFSQAFQGQYALTVNGDQFGANDNDNIQISSSDGASVAVVLNGESFSFEPKAITAMTIDTRGGTNTVQVNSLSYRTSLDIISTGAGSNDSVVLGANGSLAGIKGSVNVANGSGQTSMSVNEAADGVGPVTLTQSSLAFANDPLANITYQDGYVGGDGLVHGVTSLTLDAAPGSSIDAQSVGALTKTSVYWYPGLTGLFNETGLLWGPAANQVAIIYPVSHTF